MNIIALPHTGLWWFDVLICVVSGVAFIALCYLVPRYWRENRLFYEAMVEDFINRLLDKLP